MGQNDGYYKLSPEASVILKDTWKAVGKSRGYYPDEMRAWLQGQKDLILQKLKDSEIKDPESTARASATLQWIDAQMEFLPAGLTANKYLTV